MSANYDGKNIIEAFPAKRFFVDMLTRDIELLDAVLDLIDNSLDGAMRELRRLGKRQEKGKYQGYKVEIEFNKERFRIKDNCGGIPREVAIHSAFRMGRPSADIDQDLPTVGVYGIGMKRSIFKMGKSCKVITKTSTTNLTVNMSPEWMADDDDWSLPYQEQQVTDASDTGTEIIVESLREGIKRIFSLENAFYNDLKNAAEVYYSSFIENGFEIKINGTVVSSSANVLAIEEDFFNKKEAISPYVYIDEVDGVKISVMIGFYRGFITPDEEDNALRGTESKASSSKAGITIICNDRVVLNADKTRKTGWGESGVPRYHTQFISIAGVVKFQCNDPSKLPLTTTKRGIEGNSDLYLKVKDRIKEGLKIFTSFTNKWKNRQERARLSIQSGGSRNVIPSDIIEKIPQNKWTNMRGEENKNARKFIPNLPMPTIESTERRITFSRPAEDIKTISEFYFENESASPKEVGEKCFDEALRRAK
ncbi:ATP-binding protein [Halomonas sp. LC1]|uniref:ATP-binding protein n=1 Tax=Halomonas sp. LC1 TaxID=3043733 RepID=UPI0025555030|nr:ATP-binding protein [Halomonas sp. LC1]MDK9686359.1 ATP-binding protein [Halomonas sp. LC1]